MAMIAIEDICFGNHRGGGIKASCIAKKERIHAWTAIGRRTEWWERFTPHPPKKKK